MFPRSDTVAPFSAGRMYNGWPAHVSWRFVIDSCDAIIVTLLVCSFACLSNLTSTRTLSHSRVLSLGAWIGVSVTVLSMRNVSHFSP
jgi:hypothetical protein